MKKSNQFVGLPIISIADGAEVGHVKSLVVNPKEGMVDFLTVEHADWQISVRAVPFKKIVGVGEFAVMIEDSTSIFDLTEIPIANELVQKKITVVGAKLIDRKGQLIGEATEFFINEDTGAILGLELSLRSKKVILSSEQLITYGRDLIVIKEEAQLNFLDKAESLLGGVVEVEEEVAVSVETNELSEFQEKQLKLLTGRTTTKDIFERNGELLFPNGTTLNKEDVRKAQEKGPAVLAELSMNVVG
ncbi:PRC-barrel domain-containing protein [Fictibacillus phosphorivorans]|uniref:PRC-barrel domain-containing protein n=1 Tax=Fictibacillus phosphorivorans TaxID=1221500 RepID=UPI001293AE4C|nr:PRC-barrel domain-containing protein [Fictibacillus phosphorivorans]MQR94840.1 photosystem reaction center subunit H [Fictibacillus phosphorivorans]